MSSVIRIPEDLYSRLEQHAQGFDTPANVIEALLNHFEGIDQEVLNREQTQGIKKRDTTKYSFKKHEYGKGKLVLAVIKDYVDSTHKVTFESLLKVFPKALQGSIGVFSELTEVQKEYENKKHKRHFVKDIISLSDCNIVVCTEWRIDNIDDFIEKSKSSGYVITLSTPRKND